MVSTFRKNIEKAFPFEPTDQQAELFELLDDFIDHSDEQEVFILKGYAGTGKTTVISAMIEAMKKAGKSFVLLAPTGRAAKVISNYSGQQAQTLHKHIYTLLDTDSLTPEFELRDNEDSDTLYIVDESSMIADENTREGSNLLGDLITYVFSAYTQNNQLLLMGDDAQLPPVFSEESPALKAEFITKHYDLNVREYALSEVKRQSLDSGILKNAEVCRKQLLNGQGFFQPIYKGFKDTFRVPSNKIIDGIKYAFNKFGKEQTIVLCKSNKEAVRLNQMIRYRVLEMKDTLSEGDRLMVVKNSYHSLPDDFLTDFIANGEFVEVVQVVEFFEKYDLRFAKLELRLLDFESDKTFFSLVLMDSLESDKASVAPEVRKNLFREVLEDMDKKEKKKDKNQMLKTNPYLNALEVKYAYAVTTHKSQGGQWDAVFVSFPPINDSAMVRWAYTAITRAKKELFLF